MRHLLLSVAQIWSALDAGRYVHSTALYLLAQHTYRAIQLDVHTTNIVSRFPLLARHANSISHFRSTILQVFFFTTFFPLLSILNIVGIQSVNRISFL